MADKPVETGHFVRLESGQEGRVTRIGWRSTWIRTLAEDVIVVPNARLAESVIVNRNLPDPTCEITVEVGVRYDSDLDRVESVTLAARHFEATYRLRHELIKRLRERYRREGIVMPFPTRTLDLPPGRRFEVV